MDSNFVKTENDNDMDNDIETEPKARHSTPVPEPEEVDEPRGNATELSRNIKIHNSIMKKSNQTISIW